MPDSNNRITTQQFYEALLAQNEQMQEMERRILGKLENLPAIAKQVENNQDAIKVLHGRSNIYDILLGVGVVIGSAIGSLLGPSE